MLDYFQTTYERTPSRRAQPPENMQRKSNKVLYDRMWGGSRQNMLGRSTRRTLGIHRRRRCSGRNLCWIISQRRWSLRRMGLSPGRCRGAAGARPVLALSSLVSSVVYSFTARRWRSGHLRRPLNDAPMTAVCAANPRSIATACAPSTRRAVRFKILERPGLAEIVERGVAEAPASPSS